VEWARRRGAGGGLPVIWENPGAYGQLARVPAEVVYALPPPPPPLWPIPESELTWRYARAFLLALGFVSLAAYVQLQQRLAGDGRWQLETAHPRVAAALAAAHLLPDLEDGSVDRPALLARVAAKYGDGGADGGMPAARAAALLHALTHPGEPPSAAAAAGDAAAAAGGRLSGPAFVDAAAAATAHLSTASLVYGVQTVFGVAAA